jgi:SGNH hydrolase-like domain, acetyltransferase AlgX
VALPRAAALRAGLLAVSLALTFGTLEVALRLFGDRSPFLRALLHDPSDRLAYQRAADVGTLLELAPFHAQPFQVWAGFKLNSLGFRTPEYTRVKPPGTYRVIALGDSFTFDSGFVPLDGMWHALVGARLAERTGRPVEVVNLGVLGIGPCFALRLFQLEGQRLAPDLVLFGLFVGNDLTDEQPDARPRWHPSRWSFGWRFGRRLVGLLRVSGGLHTTPTDGFTGPGGFPTPGYVYDPDVVVSSEEAFIAIERDAARIFVRTRRPQVEGWITDVVRTVATLDGAVRAVGARLVVVVIPDQVQIDPVLRRTVVESSGIPAAEFDFDGTATLLVRGLADAGVTAVDLLPAFRAAPPTPRLYRRWDTHWSAAGNALAAEEIVTFLGTRDRIAAP